MKTTINRSGLLAVAMAAAVAHAGPFTAGNIVVNRVGDGSGALTSAATALFLDEFTQAGVFAQSIALPVVDNGGQQTLTASGTSTSEGFMAMSTDARYIVLGGYDAPVATAAVSGTDSSVFNRIVGRAAADGTIDTTTNIAEYNGSNIRSAASEDGSKFFLGGQAGSGLQATAGVRIVDFGPGNISTQLSADVTNTRVVKIFNNQLYVGTMSGAFRGVSTVGSGIPTTAGQIVTLLPGFDPSTTSPQDNYDFWFATDSTLYVADNRPTATGGGVQRWDFDGSTWILTYTLNLGLASGCRGMIVSTDKAGTSTIFATTTEASSNSLVSVVDLGAISSFAIIATAPANTRFRGLAFAPIGGAQPEVVHPSSYTTVRGSNPSGNNASLGADDNDYLRHCKFIVPNQIVPPVEVRVNGTTTLASTTGISAALKGKMGNAGSFSHSVEQFNFVGSTNEDIATAVANTTESTVTSNSTGTHSRYIGAAGALQARYTIRKTGPSTAVNWCYDADEFSWTVNP